MLKFSSIVSQATQTSLLNSSLSYTTQRPIASSTSMYCVTEKGRLLKGQVFKRDDCTNCICKSNGQVICERIGCEARNCLDGSKLRHLNGICCPLCENEIKSRYPNLKFKAQHFENNSNEKDNDDS